MDRRLLLLVPFSIALSISLPLLYGGSEALDQLDKIHPWHFAVLIGMVLSTWLFNAVRMSILVNGLGGRLPPGRAYASVMSAEFAGAATPAYTGGMATYTFLYSRYGLSVGQSAAVVAADQLTDLLFMATALPLVLLVLVLGFGVGEGFNAVVVFVVLMGVGVPLLFWLPRHYRPAALWLGRVMRRLPFLHRARFRLARWLIQFREGVRTILRLGPRRLLLTYIFCVLQWGARYGILPVLAMFLGYDVPWAFLFIAQAVILSVGHVSFLPGGAGGVELTFGALLSAYLSASEVVAAMLLWRFCTFHSFLILGAPAFLLTVGRHGMEVLQRR